MRPKERQRELTALFSPRDPLVDESALAEATRIDRRTLQSQRCRGVGFPYTKIGACVRYHWPAGKRLLTEGDAAAMLGCSPITLQVWRQRDCGPPYVKVGFLVRYAVDDIRAYIGQQRRTSTAQGAARAAAS